jgi:hypothetical protein
LNETTALNIAPLVHWFTVDTMLELIYGPTVISHPYTDSETGGNLCSVLHTTTKMAWSFSLCPTYGWIMNSRPVSALLRKTASSIDMSTLIGSAT